MTLRTFDDRDEFLRAVTDQIGALECPPELSQAIALGISTATEGMHDENAADAGAGLNLRLGMWFLRTDDAPFFEVIGVVGTTVATLIATGGLALPAAVGAVTALSAAAWRTWRRGGRLTRQQLAVVTLIQSKGPMEERDLLPLLAAHGMPMTVYGLRATLRQLKHVELHDGSLASLTRYERDGKWRVVGV